MANVVLNKYELLQEIGRGSFSAIYKAKDIYTGKCCAIKIEPKNRNSLILREAHIHNILHNVREIPKLLWFGFDEGQYYMVLPLLCGNFRGIHLDVADTMGEWFRIGHHMLLAVRALHSKGYIHRDIKPDNFMYNDRGEIFLIDLGLCKQYVINGTHIAQKPRSTLIGTINYISVNVHNMEEPSRRDDVESVCYVLWKIWGGLDWDNNTTTHDALSTIKKKKIDLLYQPTIPCKLFELLHKTRDLNYWDEPCYEL
jgi:serine/threonine protein kinase